MADASSFRAAHRVTLAVGNAHRGSRLPAEANPDRDVRAADFNADRPARMGQAFG